MTFDNNEGSRHESAAPRGEDEAIAHVLGPFEDDSEAYDKGVDPSPLTKVLEWTAILLLFGILSMVILQVTTRFSAASFPWTEELARHFLLWLVFVAAWIGVRRNEHFRAGVLDGKLGQLGVWSVRVISSLTLLLIAYGCIQIMIQIGGNPTFVLGWPLTALYFPVALTAIGMAVDVLRKL